MSRYTRWTVAKVQEEIARLHSEGADLCSKEIQDSYSALYHAALRRFDSWRHAIESVGLDYSAIAQRIARSREEMVAILGDLHADGVSLTDATMRRQFPALHATAIRHFGSWRIAREIVSNCQSEQQLQQS